MNAMSTISRTTIKTALDEMRKDFRTAGIESADIDARLIIAHILDMSQARLISDPEFILGADDIEQIHRAGKRRLDREPVSRILGQREFWSRTFEISRATLDPRPDTESLITAALQIIAMEEMAGRAIEILDLGTGSGCILLTLLAECDHATGVGIDIDPGALVTARKNGKLLGLDQRAQFVCANWTEPLRAEFDIVIANPPYIKSADIPGLMPEVRTYDPHMALDGGDDGLDAYRKILSGISKILTNGWLLFEFGEGQLDDVLQLIRKAGFGAQGRDCLILGDLNGNMRCVAAKARF